MIKHGRQSKFAEWASNFSEDIFVMIKVFADETGTHDGADVVALAGVIDSRGHWDKFGGKWRKALKNHDAPFFHYREFRKNANTNQGDPFYDWTDEERRNFLFDLAMLVGGSAVPSGGAYPIEYNEQKGIINKPFEATIYAFYESTLTMIKRHWPSYTGRALFIFDKCSKKEWVGPLVAIHEEYRNTNPRVGSIAFGDDKKDPEHIALQAADFSAIHWRNTVRGYTDADCVISEFDIGILDFIVSKNMDIGFRNLPKERTEKIVADLRKEEALQRSRGFKGPWFPDKHFDFNKYGYPK